MRTRKKAALSAAELRRSRRLLEKRIGKLRDELRRTLNEYSDLLDSCAGAEELLEEAVGILNEHA